MQVNVITESLNSAIVFMHVQISQTLFTTKKSRRNFFLSNFK